jgi:hypothetical protein
MAYLSRHAARKRSALSAEFMYLLFVLAAGAGTAVWFGQKIGTDLSAITTIASVLGVGETKGHTRPVGYSVATAQEQATSTVAYCTPGEVPSFSQGLGTLRQRVGDAMGTPVECAHASSAAGDTVQQTTTGLAAYYSLTDTVTFTDGWRHWAITPNGYVTWEGTQSQPPMAASGPGAG